mgnify:CR=1 FL=1
MENEGKITFLEFVRQTRPEYKDLSKAEFIRQISAECGCPTSISNFQGYMRGYLKMPLKHKIKLMEKYKFPLSVLSDPNLV